VTGLWRTLLEPWLRKPFSTIVLVLGFFVGVGCASVSLSAAASVQTQNRVQDTLNYAQTVCVQLHATITLPVLSHLVATDTPQAEVIYTGLSVHTEGAGSGRRSSHTLAVVAFGFGTAPTWTPVMVSGTFLSPAQTSDGSRVVIVNGDLTGHPPHVNTMVIDGQTYHITGVYAAPHGNFLYGVPLVLPIGTYDRMQSGMFPNLSNEWSFYLIAPPGASPESLANTVAQAVRRIDPRATYSLDTQNTPVMEAEGDAQWLVIIGSLIVLITTINTTNLCLFWVMDRRRDLAIAKALGATPVRIVSALLMELVSLPMIGAALALAIQWLASFATPTIAGVSLRVTYANLVLGTVVALAVGVLVSIAPLIHVGRLSPSEILRIK